MISLEVKGNDTALAFAELDRRLTDLSPIMAQIAEFLLDTTLARFQQGVAPDGSPWAPKSPSTIAAYQARKQAISYRPLIGPTKSLSSATNFATASGQDWARISSRAIQSAVMQLGAKKGAFGANKAGRPIPWGDIPARPFLGTSAKDQAGLVTIFEQMLGAPLP